MTETGFRDDLDKALLLRAKSLKPLLQRNAAAHEQNGELSAEVVDALAEAGLWKMAVPRRWGGLCVSANGMANIALELAKGCPSTSWVVAVENSGIWMLSVMPDAIQESVFGGTVPRAASVGLPPGTAKPVEGGYIVNSRWPYGSGSHHADLAYGPVMIEGREGPPAMAIVSRQNYSIDRTWLVAGMRGTGSDTIVVKDVFVPNNLMYIMDKPLGTHEPGKKHVGEASDYWATLPLLRSKALGVLIGAAEGLLEHIIDSTKTKPIVQTTYKRRMDSSVFQSAIGEAAAKIATARLLMDETTKSLDVAAIARRVISPEERAANRGKSAAAIDILIGVVERLMTQAGSSGFLESNDAQRYWRDFSTGARHAVLIPDMGYEVLGRSLLGVEPNIVFPDFV